MSYKMWNREFDGKGEAESFLTAMFVDMCQDLEIDFGNDAAAWRGFFNDWTDDIHRDGIICDDSVQYLCPVGDRFE